VSRGALRALLPALVGAGAVLAGAFAADPLGAVRLVADAALRAGGAHAEFFTAPDGTRLRTLVAGPLSAERPVVLLHGLGTDATYWTPAIRALRDAGRTAIAPDAPGSGGSGTPDTPDGFSLAARVAAVEALATALRLDRFDLVGHSLGGATAGLFALAHPRQVGTLVLVDADGFSQATPAETKRFREIARPEDRAEARELLNVLFFAKPVPPVGAVVDALARRFRSPNVQATIEEAGRPDVLVGREGELPRGTVLIWGAKESLFPVSDARSAAARIPDARLVVVPDAGHDVPLERPAEFRRALLAALGAR
jgi:pimeloyl-ACP methyl ester carboxylesterase